MDEAAEDTDSVLAAYREKKRKALEAQRAGANATSPGPAVSAPAVPVAPATPAVPGPPAAAPPPVPTPAPARLPPAPPLPASPAPNRALEPARPTGLTSAPGATLSALGPALRLSDALLKDTRVSVKGSPRVRGAGIALVLLGLLFVVLDRRATALGAPVPEYLLVGLGLAGLGCLLVVVGMNLPRHRRLAVRLAASQRDEWKRVQGESARLAWMSRGGLALAILGLLGLAFSYSAASMALLALTLLLTLAGLALLVVAQARRSIARRLYVQTLVLSGLDASGLGGVAADERVQPVILALDNLLGALPEAEVQAFLATPQARAYLELVDEAMRSKRDA